jgi:hypothetical protein
MRTGIKWLMPALVVTLGLMTNAVAMDDDTFLQTLRAICAPTPDNAVCQASSIGIARENLRTSIEKQRREDQRQRDEDEQRFIEENDLSKPIPRPRCTFMQVAGS